MAGNPEDGESEVEEQVVKETEKVVKNGQTLNKQVLVECEKARRCHLIENSSVWD